MSSYALIIALAIAAYNCDVCGSTAALYALTTYDAIKIKDCESKL